MGGHKVEDGKVLLLDPLLLGGDRSDDLQYLLFRQAQRDVGDHKLVPYNWHSVSFYKSRKE